MIKVSVNASRQYDVMIGSGLLQNAGQMIRKVSAGTKVIVVSDDNVYPIYGDSLSRSLAESGFEVYSFVIENGEKSKNLTEYGRLLNTMCEKHFTRRDVVAGLGGGVVGDLAGFAAATYQRGTGFVQIPTSLLAAVDSSVGGKTAIDLDMGKNQVGCFYQPLCVICDTDTLKTLPDEEYSNGCAEVIKYAMIQSRELFEKINDKPVKEQYGEVIRDCVSMKRDYVERDEFDTGERMKLNFGHTIGHAVETLSNYTIPHGQAVAIGMAKITRALVRRQICPAEVSDRLQNLLEAYNLRTDTDFADEELVKVTLNDKKGTGRTTRLVIVRDIGESEILEVSNESMPLYV